MAYRPLKAALLIGATLAGVTQGPRASAQDVQDGIGDIVVTARRVEERLQDVPISITVFTQQQLADRNIVSSADLGTYTPSLTVNSRFGAEKSSFTLRGFGQDAGTSPSVGVYFADVIAPRTNAQTTSGNGAGVGGFFDLQNLQVLKGPQGTLFGRNTTGGAILLVPQRPTGRLEGYVEGTYGNYDQKRVQAVLNIPLSDTFRIRAGVDRNLRDGYMRNKTNVGPRDFADVNYWAARLSIVGDLAPDLENYTIFSYNRSKNNGYTSRIAVCNPAPPAGGPRFTAQAGCEQLARHNARGDSLFDVENNAPDPYLQIEQWQAINTTTWKVSDTLTVKNIASYSEFRERFSYSNNGDNFTMPAFNPAFPPVLAPTIPAGTPFYQVFINPAPDADNTAQSSFTEELQLQGSSLDDRLQWQLGAYLEVSKPLGFSSAYNAIFESCTNVQALQCVNAFGGAGSISAPYIKSYFNNKGFYGQATYKITDKLSLTGGLRYTIDELRLVSEFMRIRFTGAGNDVPTFFCNDTLRFRGPPNPATGAPTPLQVTDKSQCHQEFRTKAKRPTWLINLDYKPTDDMLLYAKYARGYRQGGLNPLNIGLEEWGPEQLDSYELGFKASFQGAVQGYFNLAAFYNDLTNQQLQANLIAKPGSGLAGGNAIINAGRSRLKGIEAEGSISPVTGLRLDVGYAYLDTKLLSQTAPIPDPESPFSSIDPRGAVGEPLTLAPKHRFTATLNYTLPLDDSIGAITFGATYTHTSSQIADRNSIVGILPATDLLNLNLNWAGIAGRPIDVALFATNVTNEVYPASITSSWVSGGYESFIMAPPRMYGVRLKYRFGS